MWLPQLLQRITTSSKPSLLTLGYKIEYFSSVGSSGESTVPHLGHGKSPFPSILVKSSLWMLVSFIFFVSCGGFKFYSLLPLERFNLFFKILPKSLPNLLAAITNVPLSVQI